MRDPADQPGQLTVTPRLVGEAVEDPTAHLSAMSSTATRAGQQAFGGPEVLELTEVDRPAPLPTEVLVRVRAVGVNPVEAVIRSGRFPLLGEPPFILGWDVCGVVADIEPGVTRFRPGDEVYGMPFFPRPANAYAEYVAAPSRQLARKPASLSYAEAAALPLAGLTAWQALVDTARVAAGQRVLIHGAPRRPAGHHRGPPRRRSRRPHRTTV